MQNKMTQKPERLRKKISPSAKSLVESSLDKDVCEEAMCPNISECFSQNEAAFFICGTICTRYCSFCAVQKGVPLALDPDEPANIAASVKELGLGHAVITSPTRDDLVDGGAEQFCKTVRAVKSIDSSIVVELLIPDMHENPHAIEMIAKSGVEIVGHNLETVPRLYGVRKGSEYRRSLHVLKMLRTFNPSLSTKSGIMLGLGEKDKEVISLFRDLRSVGCSYLSIGQYLPPSKKHASLVEYVRPERFEYLREIGLKMGFKYIKSSPYTRSSYMVHELEKLP